MTEAKRRRTRQTDATLTNSGNVVAERMRLVSVGKREYMRVGGPATELGSAAEKEAIAFAEAWAGAPVSKLSLKEKNLLFPRHAGDVFEWVSAREFQVIDGGIENTEADGDNEDMGKTAGFYAVADYALKQGLSIAEFKQAVEEKLTAKAHAAGHATTRRAKARPRALWEKRKGEDAKLSPPEFIAKHYAAEMTAGTLHRGVIAQEDKPLAVKLASWLRSNPMPEGIDIPTKPEWNTRQLAKLPALRADPITREAQRLDLVARNRARRASLG